MKRTLAILLTFSLLLLPALLFASGDAYIPNTKAGQTAIACYFSDITSTNKARKTVNVTGYLTNGGAFIEVNLKIVFGASTKAYRANGQTLNPVPFSLADIKKGKKGGFTLVGKKQGKTTFKAQAVYYW